VFNKQTATTPHQTTFQNLLSHPILKENLKSPTKIFEAQNLHGAIRYDRQEFLQFKRF